MRTRDQKSELRNQKGKKVGILYVVLVCLLLCTDLFAYDFEGGTGEPDDPYQIATAEQLISVGNDPNLLDKHFVMIADIDLSEMIWTMPVIPSFSGTFDGKDLTISNLTIRGAGGQGLFGDIRDTAQVRNLGVTRVDVIGTRFVGGLASHSTGSLSNCYSDGAITAAGSYAGGLVGSNAGTISDCQSTVEVTGNDRVGGLVGNNGTGILSRCYSTGLVIGDSTVGGLVGRNEGLVTSCYSGVETLGRTNIGGLAGENGGLISVCYANGPVVGWDEVGGLVGYNYGRISSSYSHSDEVVQWSNGNRFIGGLVGRGSAHIEDSYFLAPSDGGGPDNENGTPLTLEQMKTQTSFPGWDFWGSDLGGSSDDWFMPTGGTPVLPWQVEVTGLYPLPAVAGLSLQQAQQVLEDAGLSLGEVRYDFDRILDPGLSLYTDPLDYVSPVSTVTLVLSLGPYDWTVGSEDGTAANPYTITTPGQLESLVDHPELYGRHFVLTNDIDLAFRTKTTALIAPDGVGYDDDVDYNDDFDGTPFSGTFDGKDHAIRNLSLINRTHVYLGLFGMIAPEGKVMNVNVLGARVLGSSRSPNVGIVAGYNSGTVNRCVATGFLTTGCGDLDALVGTNDGQVVDCERDITVIRGRCGTR